MHFQLTILVLFVATTTTLAIPLSQTTPPSTKFSSSSPVKVAQNDANLKPSTVKLTTQGSPYKFAYKAPTSSASKLSALPEPMSTQMMNLKQSPVSDKNSEKNWLLTKAWLIDNINRLRRELSELERDYSQHLDTVDQANSQKEKQWMEDITKLRADHTVLSQQQKQIIYLIKKNQLLRSKPFSENDIHYVPVGGKSLKVADAPIRRQIKRDLSQNYGDNFETETRRNLKEIFTEVSSLHDITINLVSGLRSLESRVDTRDKFSK